MRRRAIILAWLGLATALGGCTTDGQDVAAFRQSGGAALAFESIDGPPPQVFDRMVNAVNAEAQTKSIAVTSRAAPAAYRVRAYLAAQLHRGRSVIAWVWDVYDQNQQRAMRLSGAETTGKSGRDAWAAADDRVIARIAERGMAGVASLVGGGSVSVGAPEPQVSPQGSPNGSPAPDGAAVASAESPAEESGSSAASRIALSYAAQ